MSFSIISRFNPETKEAGETFQKVMLRALEQQAISTSSVHWNKLNNLRPIYPTDSNLLTNKQSDNPLPKDCKWRDGDESVKATEEEDSAKYRIREPYTGSNRAHNTLLNPVSVQVARPKRDLPPSPLEINMFSSYNMDILWEDLDKGERDTYTFTHPSAAFTRQYRYGSMPIVGDKVCPFP